MNLEVLLICLLSFEVPNFEIAQNSIEFYTFSKKKKLTKFQNNIF